MVSRQANGGRKTYFFAHRFGSRQRQHWEWRGQRRQSRWWWQWYRHLLPPPSHSVLKGQDRPSIGPTPPQPWWNCQSDTWCNVKKATCKLRNFILYPRAQPKRSYHNDLLSAETVGLKAGPVQCWQPHLSCQGGAGHLHHYISTIYDVQCTLYIPLLQLKIENK